MKNQVLSCFIRMMETFTTLNRMSTLGRTSNCVFVLLLTIASMTPMAVASALSAVLDELEDELKGRTRSYSTEPFSVTSELPSNYFGNDPIELCDALKEIDGFKEKGEFETTEQYRSRLAAGGDRGLLGNLYIDSQLAFAFRPDLGNYDADAGTLQIKIDTGFRGWFLSDNKKKEYSKIETRAKHYDRGEYVGSNAYGATVTVSRSSMRQWGVAFERDTAFDRVVASGISLKVSAATAMAMKVAPRSIRLMALVVGRSVEPRIVTDYSHKEAKFDSPSEYFSSSNYVNIIPEDLLLYDANTGKVFFALSSLPRKILNMRNVVVDKRIIVTYDLDASYPMNVRLVGSNDGGQTYDMNVVAVSGDVGPMVPPGRSKQIIWEALDDYPKGFGSGAVELDLLLSE